MNIDFLEVVRKRKSIRSFSAQPVPRELIEKILAVAVEAPTNCNQQLWNFIVVDDSVIKERLIKEAASNTMFRRAPVLIAVTYDNWNYKEAIQGASLAVGHILLAAAYYGVNGSPVNSYGSDRKVKKILRIPRHETICCFVTLGFPDEKALKAPPVSRRKTADITHWNIFEKRSRPPFTYNPDDWSLNQLRLHQKRYCRKTSLGKEMDLAGYWERALVKKILKDKSGPFLDLMSYDGSFLKEFPKGEIDALDLTEETALYTKETGAPVSMTRLYNESSEKFPGEPRTITLLYKAERLPQAALEKIFKQAYQTLPQGGELIIISRRRPSLFSLFLLLLRLIFGNDIRKTGIYAFFGPYRPVSVRRLVKFVKHAQFKHIDWSGYLVFPGFFEQTYQMVVQYIKSEGSSYLHRDRRDDFVSRSIAALLSSQKFIRCGVLGSVAVIQCRK